MPAGKPILVKKNLRVCVDCHSAINLISKDVESLKWATIEAEFILTSLGILITDKLALHHPHMVSNWHSVYEDLPSFLGGIRRGSLYGRVSTVPTQDVENLKWAKAGAKSILTSLSIRLTTSYFGIGISQGLYFSNHVVGGRDLRSEVMLSAP
ncbi:hypothetical protein IFM89_035838 [Coptis chinensis]|uniref:DYW domain-containing protein n=1 Tax=Coptis chinensis TaxID=261450 RepID=A0A835HS18_9MAGN|nr:hypothetical protein IFM89_035838 [Coptis chinensis]